MVGRRQRPRDSSSWPAATGPGSSRSIAPAGLNAARNLGVRSAQAELIVLLDDDVRAGPGGGWARCWPAPGMRLSTASSAARSGPSSRAAARARCGREPAADHDARPRPGRLRCPIRLGRQHGPSPGRLRRAGRVRRGAGGPRRRGGVAAPLRGRWRSGALHRRGRNRAPPRAADARLARCRAPPTRSDAPPAATTSAKHAAPRCRWSCVRWPGCAWHTLRRRCAYGVVMGAHSAGRVAELATERRRERRATRRLPLRNRGQIDGDPRRDAGHWPGMAGRMRWALARGVPWRLRRAAPAGRRRRVLVLAVERDDAPNLLAAAAREIAALPPPRALRLGHDRRARQVREPQRPARRAPGGRSRLAGRARRRCRPARAASSTRFVFLAERFGLRLAQPAHRQRSHAAWAVTRRQAGSVARETAFVEIGPVVGLHASTFETLLPFPRAALRLGP